jgi:Alcohol dehydrogenase GroES-like domain
MKALVKYESGVGHVELRDVEDPRCGDDQVKIEVSYCGVCGTDLHVYEDTLRQKNKTTADPVALPTGSQPDMTHILTDFRPHGLKLVTEEKGEWLELFAPREAGSGACRA